MTIQLIACGSRPWEYWAKYWGLSLLVGDDVLFDTFANDRVLSKNMKRFNVTPRQIQKVVISHDHWDHTGGLEGLLERHKGLDVYLPHGASEKTKEAVRAAGGNVIDGAGIKELGQDLYVSDELAFTYEGRPMAEQMLVHKSPKGLLLIIGCSHPGIASMIERAKQDFGTSVYGVIGGFHLMNHSLKDVRAAAEELKAMGVQVVAPTHCTGWSAERVFKSVFGDNFVQVKEGKTVPLGLQLEGP